MQTVKHGPNFADQMEMEIAKGDGRIRDLSGICVSESDPGLDP